MPKKLTYEFVKEQFEKEGYKLLEEKYINSKSKLKYKCEKGHYHSITWASWLNGSRCAYCANRPPIDINFINNLFNEEGYNLLTKEYKNAHQKLKYICPDGHKHYITWSNWNKGQRCAYCANVGKKALEFIKLEFSNEKYKLLTEFYRNSNQKLDYLCSNGHKNCISWRKWNSGRRCPTCYYLKKFGSGNPNWKGGITYEPYCDIWLDKDFKESIKARDNYTCQNPDCWQTSNKLVVHHIYYIKKDCHPGNLITLCNSCNSRANKNRNYWQKLYNSILNNKQFEANEVL